MTNKKNKVMIVIERTWKEPDSIGGGRLNKVARKCFADDDLDAELDKYIKGNFTIDKEQLDRFNIEEKYYMYSMDKSDMEKMVRYFTGNYKIPVSDDLEEAAKLYVSDSLCITGEEDWDDAAIEALNAYKAGAKWQKEQMMKDATDGQLENGEDYLRIKCLSMGCHNSECDGKFVKLIIIKED